MTQSAQPRLCNFCAALRGVTQAAAPSASVVYPQQLPPEGFYFLIVQRLAILPHAAADLVVAVFGHLTYRFGDSPGCRVVVVIRKSCFREQLDETGWGMVRLAPWVLQLKSDRNITVNKLNDPLHLYVVMQI